MKSSIEIVCFTDLVQSTDYTEKKGHLEYDKYYEEHLRVGKEIANLFDGEYVKNIGDSHLIKFRDPLEALKFSILFQQYHKDQDCLSILPFKVRISLFLGTISESNEGDIFGEAVNKSSRVEGLTGGDEIFINSDLLNSLLNILGYDKKKYFDSIGKHKLKGISNPIEIYNFHWSRFLENNDNSEYNLAKYIMDFFDSLSIVSSNLFVSDLSKPNLVIWPVVPRDIVNAIHRAQIEIIRLLALLGWQIKVLLADCGSRDNPKREYSKNFENKIINYSKKRNLTNIDFYYLSDLFDPKYPDYHKLHKIFQKVISNLTLQDLLDINNKAYDETVKTTIKKSATLDFLRPALTISAVFHLSQKTKNKCITIAGEDEKIQWETSHDLPNSRENLGVIFNPIIRKNNSQIRQTKNWPFWDSWQTLYEDMEGTNLAEWLIKMYLLLPNFPISEIEINGTKIHFSKLLEFKDIDKKFIAKSVYNGLLSITH